MTHLNMREAFDRWTLGCTSFPQWADLYGAFFAEWHGSDKPFDDWLFERMRPVLQRRGTLYFYEPSSDSGAPYASVGLNGHVTIAELLVIGSSRRREFRREIHSDEYGTVKEWPAQ